MDEQQLATIRRQRSRKFQLSLGLVVLGLGAVALGLLQSGAPSDATQTAAGVAVGAGVALAGAGAVVAWFMRPGSKRWMEETSLGRRDRLQAQRAQQLFLFPVVALIFSALAIEPTLRIAEGGGVLRDWLAVLLPVLYAWVTAATAMGWDVHSRQHRRFLEDELTAVIRARAVTAAFLVLMTGATAALGLSIAYPRFGALALIFALVAAGATAGVRFAWLDRKAGQDG